MAMRHRRCRCVAATFKMRLGETQDVFLVKDVTDWVRLNTEQMGTKPKFWCLDHSGTEFLFKESRSHSGEQWSEKVAAEIAGVLGLPHAEIELAVCDGKNGTLSQNFLSAEEPSSLIHGNELLFEHDPDYPIDAPNFRLVQHTLDRIISGLRRSGAKRPDRFSGPKNVTSACELFVGYLLLDALIVNTDRHHANWGVIISPCMDGTYLVEMAPTFDHASSLGRELSDSHRLAKLESERNRHEQRHQPRHRAQTIVGYLESEKGRGRIYPNEQNAKPLHPLQVFARARDQFPDAGDAWIDQLASLQMTVFENIISGVPAGVMSQPARDFSLNLIDLNRTALITRTFQYA